jgi:hypothetical protein
MEAPGFQTEGGGTGEKAIDREGPKASGSPRSETPAYFQY